MRHFLVKSEPAEPLGRGGALDLLRFFAAGFIVLYHFEAYAPAAFADIHPALTRGYLATDFFLMLSGYVLGRTYGPRLEHGRVRATGFLLRRVARVWPGHLVVLLGLAVLVLAASAAGVGVNNREGFDWSALPAHALLVQAWGLGVPYGWNFPTWSLSALIVCYAAFPFLWTLLARVSGPVALAAAVLALVVADLAAQGAGRVLYALPPEIGVLRALPLFCLGAALARYGSPCGLTAAGARVLGLGALAAFLGLQLLGRFDLVAVLLMSLAIIAAGARSPRRPWAPVRAVAELSFAVYLTHLLAGILWYRAVGVVAADLEGPAAWAAWATGFPAALAAAWLFNRAVDAPLQRRINRILDARKVPSRRALAFS